MSEVDPFADMDESGDHHVPADLLELHEVLEWQAAVGEETDE